MANTYHQMFIQTVFAVKYRKAKINADWKHELFAVMGNLISETGCKTIIVNGVDDHVHCFFGLKPSCSVSDVMKSVKAKSSKWLNSAERKLRRQNDQFHMVKATFSNSTEYLVSVDQQKYLKEPVDKEKLNSYYGREYKNSLEYKWEFNHWYDQNVTLPFSYLNGNVSEYCSTPITPDMVDFYKLQANDSLLPESVFLLGSNFREEIIDMKGNQNNVIFYKRIIPKIQQGETFGFRTVVRYRRVSGK